MTLKFTWMQQGDFIVARGIHESTYGHLSYFLLNTGSTHTQIPAYLILSSPSLFNITLKNTSLIIFLMFLIAFLMSE